MEKFVEQTLLYDFYGELLTERQQQVYESVVLEDYSLSEVAEDLGISRQGAHDFIKRGRRALAEYEEKLKLLERFCEIRQNLKTIQEDLQLIDRSGMQSGNLYMLDQIDKNLFRIITKI